MVAPDGLSPHGRAAWKAAFATLSAIGEDAEQARGALTLYAQAIDTAHVIRRDWIARGRPAMSEGSHGQPVAHPALASIRDQERHVERLAESLLGRLNAWGPAIEARGVARPARIYDTRSTFASNAIAAGIDVFELARIMGTSIEMIEWHYGTLLNGSAAGIASRLAAFEAEQERATDRATNRRLGH